MIAKILPTTVCVCHVAELRTKINRYKMKKVIVGKSKGIADAEQCDIHVVNYCLDHVKEGTYVAFGFNYNGGKPSEIIVDNVTSTNETKVLVHFMYGHRSLAEYVAKEDIIAIGNPKGTGKIRGWSGNFDILQPNHPLLKDCS